MQFKLNWLKRMRMSITFLLKELKKESKTKTLQVYGYCFPCPFWEVLWILSHNSNQQTIISWVFLGRRRHTRLMLSRIDGFACYQIPRYNFCSLWSCDQQFSLSCHFSKSHKNNTLQLEELLHLINLLTLAVAEHISTYHYISS